jgi:hypothetical protein
MVWQATHFSWNICLPASASFPAAFATAGAHIAAAIVARETMDIDRQFVMSFSFVICAVLREIEIGRI